jgi:hypothetical protein
MVARGDLGAQVGHCIVDLRSDFYLIDAFLVPVHLPAKDAV